MVKCYQTWFFAVEFWFTVVTASSSRRECYRFEKRTTEFQKIFLSIYGSSVMLGNRLQGSQQPLIYKPNHCENSI